MLKRSVQLGLTLFAIFSVKAQSGARLNGNDIILRERMLNEGNARRVLFRRAIDRLNYPYVRGTDGPRTFDCTGFVKFITSGSVGPAVYNLPHQSAGDMRNYLSGRGAQVDCKQALLMDIIIFGNRHAGFVIDPINEKYLSALGRKWGVVFASYGAKGTASHRNPSCFRNLWLKR